MPILTRRRVILARTESTYGVDPVPTGGANAILLRSLDFSPLDADLVRRDIVRPFLGSAGQLVAGQKVTVSMEVELAGSGTAGVAPAYGPLLRACGLAEVISATAVTGTAQAGTTSSVTLATAGTSTVDGFYVGLPITITSGAGAGQIGTIVAYNGATRVATVAATWPTAPTSTSGYSILPGVAYRPISGSYESVTIYAQLQDAVAANSPTHRITGCRGTVDVNLTAKQIPTLRFTMTGLYNAVTDTTNIVANFGLFRTPVAVNRQNTPTFNVFGLAAVANELSFGYNNEIVYRNLVGLESVLLTDRQVCGQVVIETPLISQRDFFAAAIGTALGNIAVTHGTTAGNIVDFATGNANVQNPTLSDMDGINMMTIPFEGTAVAGGDDFFLCIR